MPEHEDQVAESVLPSDSKRELQEVRTLAIKTNNLVMALSAEVREIAKRLERRERSLTLNSAVVYLVTTVILASAFYAGHRFRIERLDVEKDAALRESASMREELVAMRKREEERRKAEEKAYELYQMLRSGRSREVMARYPDVAREHLSRLEADVLREGVTRSRQDGAYAAFEAGRQAYAAGQWKRAAQEFKRSLDMDPTSPHVPQLHYLHGIALYKLGEFAAAASELERALEKGAERSVQEDARFYFAAALDQAKKRDRAKEEYRKCIERHPQSRFAAMARKRLAELEGGK